MNGADMNGRGHVEAILRAVAGQKVAAILCTHTHRDHAPLARPFAEAVGAPILAAAPPVRTIHASATLDEGVIGYQAQTVAPP